MKLDDAFQNYLASHPTGGIYDYFLAGAAAMAEIIASTGTRSRIERLLCAMLSNPTQFSLHGKTYADAAIELDSILTEHEKQFP